MNGGDYYSMTDGGRLNSSPGSSDGRLLLLQNFLALRAARRALHAARCTRRADGRGGDCSDVACSHRVGSGGPERDDAVVVVEKMTVAIIRATRAARRRARLTRLLASRNLL